MVFQHIEKLKQEYTDKYVIVDEKVAELKRFHGLTGTVRTVNMNGRALVEFAGHNNIGWYDIDVDFLSVVDEPRPTEEKKKQAAKPAKAPSKLEQARGDKSTSGKPAKSGEMSVADVLAAARKSPSSDAAPASPPAAKPAGALSVAEMLAAARAEKSGDKQPATAAAAGMDSKASLQQQLEAARQSKSAAPPKAAAAAGDPKKMSVADMLAAARAEKSGGSAPAATEEAPADAAPVQQPAEEAATEPDAAAEGSGRRNDISSVEEQLAYCRRVDGG